MNYNVYDFDINLDKIENEAGMAVLRESKYWRENDAKLRAVHQKVATYEEFKNIVAASHLKPLNKNENLFEISKGYKNNRSKNWNIFATENTNNCIENDFHKKVTNSKVIHKDKNDLIDLSEIELYNKFQLFYHENNLEVFKMEILSEILLRYCRAILNNSCCEVVQSTVDWEILNHIGQFAERLSLTMAFMSEDEKSIVRLAIIAAHSKSMKEHLEPADNLLSMFHL